MKFSNSRRAMLAAVLASAFLSMHAAAQGSWPTHTIKLVVPFGPGGSDDSLARVLASALTKRLGQTVVVENKGGAGSTLGTGYVAKSRPDGYTLMLTSTSITSTAATRKHLPYNPLTDIQPIGRIAAAPFVVVVSNKLKVKNLREFMDLARAKPGTINYGSAGVGGMNHLGTVLFASAAKVKLVHVPYQSISPAFVDLISGNLQMLLPSLPSVMELAQSGKMHSLAVTSPQRSPFMPDVPTASEAGLPGFQFEVWWGLFGPAGLPPEMVKRLNGDLNSALKSRDVQNILKRLGLVAQPSTPEELSKQIRSDLVRWKRVVKEENIPTE